MTGARESCGFAKANAEYIAFADTYTKNNMLLVAAQAVLDESDTILAANNNYAISPNTLLIGLCLTRRDLPILPTDLKS